MSSTPIGNFLKDPSENLPYAIDWSAALPSGETIASAPAAVWTMPAGITLVSQSQTTTVTTARISGGTDGTRYRVTCHIVTTPTAYELERSIEIRVTDR